MLRPKAYHEFIERKVIEHSSARPRGCITVFSDPAAIEGSEEKRLGDFRKVDELRAYLKSFPNRETKQT